MFRIIKNILKFKGKMVIFTYDKQDCLWNVCLTTDCDKAGATIALLTEDGDIQWIRDKYANNSEVNNAIKQFQKI